MSTHPVPPEQADPRQALHQADSAGALPTELTPLRIACLRRDVPDAQIMTDVTVADGPRLLVRASVAIPSGARGSGLAGGVVPNDAGWDATIAATEAIALGRALDSLGYTVSRALTAGSGGRRPTPAPAPRPQPDPARLVGSRRPDAPPAPTSPDDAALLASYSWTTFWTAAKDANLTSADVERHLGRPLKDATPADAVAALREAGVWPYPAPTPEGEEH